MSSPSRVQSHAIVAHPTRLEMTDRGGAHGEGDGVAALVEGDGGQPQQRRDVGLPPRRQLGRLLILPLRALLVVLGRRKQKTFEPPSGS